MAGNSIGQLFRVTTFGESHGLALGAIVDGVPPSLELTEADIQLDLDRRKPGTSQFATQRREDDQVKILSGVFEGKTTGTPIGLLIENTDQKSKDYGNIATTFRPVMPTTLIRKNTVFEIIAVAVVRPRAKRRCVWPQVLLRKSIYLKNLVF